jgi:hypothetical protein
LKRACDACFGPLLLFRDCLIVTLLPPGETESGSAGTQPDKG